MSKKEDRCLYSYLSNYRKKLAKKKHIKSSRQENKLFRLNSNNIKKILDNQIMPKYPNIRYTLEKSQSTDSYYVMFFYGDIYVTTRLSDHESKVGAIGIIVNENTTKQEVVDVFNQRMIDLKAKYKGYAFQKFKETMNNKEMTL